MTHRIAQCTFALLVMIGLAFSSNFAHAQDSVSGSISGTVKDSTGAVVVGATVTLTNTDRGQDIRVLKTGSAGYFTADSLPLGAYTVKMAAKGFKTETVVGLVLNAADTLTVNRTLVPGSASEVVTVTADQTQLNLESASSEGLIDAEQLHELVLNNRNYEQFLELQPGVVYGGGSDQLYVGSTNAFGASNQVNFSVNGGRNTSNNWTIDGADNVDRGANLTLLTYPSVDAISEIKTLRGQYSAEFGRSASGQIDVVTKSGTNSFHGSAYEFLRNDDMDANLWGNKLTASVQPRGEYRYNDFGATLGGPVEIPHVYKGKGKTFFFFSYEGRRVITYQPATATVPTMAERSGDFSQSWYQAPTTKAWTQGPVAVCTAFNSATGVCTAYGDSVTSTTASLSPTAAAYLKDIFSLIPAPPSQVDIAGGLDPHSLQTSIRNQLDDDQTFFRIDESVNPKLNLFYRYIHDTFPSYLGAGSFTATTAIPGISAQLQSNPGTEQLAHASYIFSPTMVADGGFAYSADSITTSPIGAFQQSISKDVNPTLPYTNTLGVIPNISLANLTALSSSGDYLDYDFNRSAYVNVTKTHGQNTIIAGGIWNHFRKQENATGGNQGGFTFNTQPLPAVSGLNAAYASSIAMSEFLLGDANGGFSQTSLAVDVDILANSLEFFVQDNYKVTPRLTLNLGVRYGYYAQPIDAHNRLNNFDAATFKPAESPTILNSGLMCLSGTCANNYTPGVIPSATQNVAGTMAANGNTGGWDGINYINGMIFGNGKASSDNMIAAQASPYGNAVGSTPKGNFAPRFGFAYDLFGDGKTSVRGGYGISYDSSEVSYYEGQAFNNPPAVSTYSLSTAVLDSPSLTSGASTTQSTTPKELWAVPLHYTTPYVQQYSLDIQHSFSPTLMIDAGYFGTHGTHLLALVDLDQPQAGAFEGVINPSNAASNAAPAYCYPTTGGTTGVPCVSTFLNSTTDRTLNSIKPYPGYFAIDTVEPWSMSTYNGLQVKATKKFKGKSMIDANYTWSRDLTTAQNDYSTEAMYAYNMALEYGRAADDRKQVLAIDGIYEMPWMKDQKGVIGRMVGGWEVSGIWIAASGLPLTVSESAAYTINYTYNGTAYNSAYNGANNGNYATDAAGIGVLGSTNAGLRPSQIGNPNNGNGTAIHNRFQWYYKGAFATPLPYGLNSGSLIGNEKRGVVSAPGYNTLDLGLFRNFRIINGLNFQLRGEAFNALNHTNLGSPVSNSISSGSWDTITSARDNRIIQVAGKIVF